MVVLCIREIHRDNLSTRKRSIYLEQAPDAGKAISTFIDPGSDTFHLVEFKDTWKCLIRRVPQQQRPVFVLLRKGYTVAEAADRLKLDKPVVRRCYSFRGNPNELHNGGRAYL